jgi:hypothetical protein
MNLHEWLAVLFVMLALAGCAQAATEQGQAPNAPYPRNLTGIRMGTWICEASEGGAGAAAAGARAGGGLGQTA